MESTSCRNLSIYQKYLIKKEKLQLPLIINYLFIAYAFSIPITGSLTNSVFTAILVLWILDGNLKEKILIALKNRFVQAVLAYYFIHFLWLWSSEEIIFAKETIKNTRFLLYVVIYITAIKKEFVFKILSGFIYAMMFSEIVSYLIFFEIIPPINNATVSNPVPFVLSHTTYALYLSISIGLALFLSFKKDIGKIFKIIYILFFISASINIFIIESRLGFILYCISIFIVIINLSKFNLKKIFLYALPIISITYFLSYNYSQTFNTRVHKTIDNFTKLIENKDFGTSLGSRVGHWYYSADTIKENFLFGVGDGDQKTLVKKTIIESDDKNANILIAIMQNGLHSEILDILVKFGFVGLIIYLNIYYQLLRNKPKDDIIRLLKILLIFAFLFSAIQGGAIVENVKDLGKLFTLLGVLVVINSKKSSIS